MTPTTKVELTPPQAADLARAFTDHETFCRECLTIRDLSGSKVPFEIFPGPRKLGDVIRKQRKRGKPVRVIVLKTRRSFFTAGVCAEMFHDVPFFPGRRGLIIADHYKPAAMEAFEYLLQFQKSYKALRRHGVGIKLPALTQDTQLRMEWNKDRSIEVLSADAGEIRGGGRHWVLCDEAAFWRALEKTLTGVLNMVPKLPGTAVIVQSTANGVGGEFYDLWQAAQDPANESGWESCFFGWLQHPPYTMPIDDPAKFQASIDGEEKLLMRMHAATLGQLQWRRMTIATECRGKVEIFNQEYPATAQDAFVQSGHPVFGHKDLARHPVCKGQSGELELTDEVPMKRLLWYPKDQGSLSLWSKPEKGHLYVIGADPSKGKDVSKEQRGKNPDYSVGFVANRHTGVQVGLLRDRLRPIRFAEYLALLGRYFNWAYIVPEANDAGFIDALLDQGYPLELIYQRQRDPTDRRPSTVEEIGFETTGLTRDWLVAAAEDAIRSMSITIMSPIVLSECQTFVVKPNGKKEHRDDSHDDCVLALALTAMGMRYAPRQAYAPQGSANTARIQQYGQKRRTADED